MEAAVPGQLRVYLVLGLSARKPVRASSWIAASIVALVTLGRTTRFRSANAAAPPARWSSYS